jgi:CRP-like cAMP-binding protein
MFEQFKKHFPLSSKKWNEYIHYFERISVPAKTVLLKEGEVSKKLFLIEKGCVRVWFNNDGKDITFQFFFENQPVSSIESFRKNIPSPVAIETIEPCIIWWIHKKDLDRILEEIKEIAALRNMFINAIFERTFGYMKHFFSTIKDTPLQRYQALIEEKPEIVQRVAQHYIASYLGITPVNLRPKKNKHEKQNKRPRI